MPDASGKPASTSGAVSEIEAVVQTYFDGLYEGDVEKLGAAFHPVSHLYSERDGEVVDLPREQWFEMVRKRPFAGRDRPARATTASSCSTSAGRRPPS